MSCYLRHLEQIMKSAGVGLTPQNRKEVDRFLHVYVKIPYKDCPRAWKQLKEIVRGEEKGKAELAAALKKKFS